MPAETRQIAAALVLVALAVLPLLPAVGGVWSTTGARSEVDGVLSAALLDAETRVDPTGALSQRVHLLLHAVAVLLLWGLLRRLPGFVGEKTAWIAAAVFAVHPLHVEAVAWMGGRGPLLGAAFGLAAAWVFLPLLPLQENEENKEDEPAFHRGLLIRWAAALLLAVAGLTADIRSWPVPIVLLILVDGIRGRVPRRAVLRLGPWLLLATAAAWRTVSFTSSGEVVLAHLPGRLLVAGRALWHHLRTILVPWPLHFDHPMWMVDVSVYWQWLFPVLILAIFGLALWARPHVGPGPVAALLSCAVLLLPHLGLLGTRVGHALVADRQAYLAVAALAVPLAAAAAKLLSGRRRLALAAAVAVLVAGAALSVRQALSWRNPETFWHATLEHNTNSWQARDALAGLLEAEAERLAGEERTEDAAQIWQEASTMRTEALDLHQDPDLFLRLARTRMREGHAFEAAFLFQGSLALRPGAPEVQLDLANALGASGQWREQVGVLRQLLAEHPDYVPALQNLAVAQLAGPPNDREGRREALAAITRACELTGYRHAWLLGILASVETDLGDLRAARKHLEEALRAVGEENEFDYPADLERSLRMQHRDLRQRTEGPRGRVGRSN